MRALLADSIPYTLDGIRGLLENYNGALWPLPVVAPLLLLPLLVAPGSGGGWQRFAPWLLAIAWIWCGQVYYLHYLEPLDWSAGYIGWLFFLQGLLLALSPWLPGRGEGKAGTTLRITGLLLMGIALVVSPVLQWWGGVPLGALAAAGITPELTLLFTLGWLIRRGAAAWLLPIPLLGSLHAFASGWALGYIPAMLPLPALLLAPVLSILLVRFGGTQR